MRTDIEQAVGAQPPLDDEFPSVEAPGVRRRLFSILAWGGCGFAAITVVSMVLAHVFEDHLRDVGLGVASLCVVAGLIGFVAVVRIAQQLDEHHRTASQVLLWATVVVYAALINVFAAALNLGPDSGLGIEFVGAVAIAVAATGAAVLAVLAIAIAIGIESPLMLAVRWAVFVALVAVPVYVIDSELWWVGLICGFLLAVAVEATINEALKRWYVPEPALAACLVAGVTAVVLLVIYVIARFVFRVALTVAEGTAAAADGAANS